MKKFDTVYNKIILECKENTIISEGLFRKAAGLLKSKKGKNKMLKNTILTWMAANKLSENGAENKFMGTLKNGCTIKFTFRSSQWNDPESTKIDYAVYLKDEEGNDIPIDRKGSFDYSSSESNIKNELTSKLKTAIGKKEAKSSLTTRSSIDKAKAKEEKAAAKAKAKEEKAAAKAKAEEEKAAALQAQAEKDNEELSE